MKIGLLLTAGLWTVGVVLFLTCGTAVGDPAMAAAPAQEEDSTPPPRAIATLLIQGKIDDVRKHLERRAKAGEEDAGEAQNQLAYLRAIGFGEYEFALAFLRDRWHEQGDNGAGALYARLQVFAEGCEAAYGTARQLQLDGEERFDLLLWILKSDHLRGMSDIRVVVAYEILQINPWEIAAQRVVHLDALARQKFARAMAIWRRLHLYGLTNSAPFGKNARRIDRVLKDAISNSSPWEELAELYAAEGAFDAALLCLDRCAQTDIAEGHALAALRKKVEGFIACRTEFLKLCREMYRAGFAGGKAGKLFNAALTKLGAGVLEEGEGFTGFIDRMKEEYRSVFLLNTKDPLFLSARMTQILAVRPTRIRLCDEEVACQELVLGAPYFEGMSAWKPLIGGAAIKGHFVHKWAETIVLDPAGPTRIAALSWFALTDPDGAAWTDLPPEAKDAPPNLREPMAVEVGFLASNKGNRFLKKAVEAALKYTNIDPDAPAARKGGRRAVPQPFMKRFFEAEWNAVRFHEARHLADSRIVAGSGKSFTKGEKELRAYLTQLRYGHPISQYRTMAMVATGADPNITLSPNEWANFKLLEGFISQIFADREVAYQLDRRLNLQLQLHLLEPEDITQIAGLIWEDYFGEDGEDGEEGE